MTKHIWFVRHGESVTNAGGDWPDEHSVPLTEKGHEQAFVVSNSLPEEPSLIVTSPFTRTKETARPSIEKWPGVRHEEWPVQEYCSICKVTRGKLTEEEKQSLYNITWNDPDYKDGISAESFNGMINRVENTIEKIYNQADRKIVIFSHGYFLSTLFYYMSNRDLSSISHSDVREYNRDRIIPNTAIVHYQFHPDRDTKLISVTTDHIPN